MTETGSTERDAETRRPRPAKKTAKKSMAKAARPRTAAKRTASPSDGAHREEGHREEGHREDGHREDGHHEDGHHEDGHREDGHRDGHEQPRKLRAARAAALAASQLRELTGRDPEAVVGMTRTDDGWRIEIEALELRRIPETTDVLACYAVEIDGDGDLVSCNRLRRYVRGAAEED